MADDSSRPPTSSSTEEFQTLATIAPIARQSVVDAVADRLRGEILSGRLRPGTRLPSERELSLALGVNRLTLRSSLARLEALGLITTRHGAGTIVASWRERAGLETLGTLLRGRRFLDPAWHELVRSALEIRRILAAEAVALAAERHTPEDVDAIATCVQVLNEHVDDPVAFARADLAFMRSVCKAARNVGLELFLNTFARWPDEHPELVAVLYDDCARAAALYPSVIELIKARDCDAARVLARKALEQVDEAWCTRHPPPAPSAAAPPVATRATPPRAKPSARQNQTEKRR
jgi:GntR family transcriptional repressor for pyruvate dehydrogenase complex